MQYTSVSKVRAERKKGSFTTSKTNFQKYELIGMSRLQTDRSERFPAGYVERQHNNADNLFNGLLARMFPPVLGLRSLRWFSGPLFPLPFTAKRREIASGIIRRSFVTGSSR